MHHAFLTLAPLTYALQRNATAIPTHRQSAILISSTGVRRCAFFYREQSAIVFEIPSLQLQARFDQARFATLTTFDSRCLSGDLRLADLFAHIGIPNNVAYPLLAPLRTTRFGVALTPYIPLSAPLHKWTTVPPPYTLLSDAILSIVQVAPAAVTLQLNAPLPAEDNNPFCNNIRISAASTSPADSILDCLEAGLLHWLLQVHLAQLGFVFKRSSDLATQYSAPHGEIGSLSVTIRNKSAHISFLQQTTVIPLQQLDNIAALIQQCIAVRSLQASAC